MSSPSSGLSGGALDHVIVLTRDLEDAAERYRRIGFQLAPRMFHPFGTGNHLIMFERNFVELLGVTHPERLTPRMDSVVQFLRDREGLSHLALDSLDAQADQVRLAHRGLAPAPVYRFERAVRLPDGRDIAAVVDNVMFDGPGPQAMCFLCRQHVHEAIWVRPWQAHPNGALGIAALSMAAGGTGREQSYFERLFGAAALTRHGDDETRVHTGGSVIRLLSPSRFEAVYGCPPPEPGPAFGAVDLAVRSLARVREVLTWGGVPHVSREGALLVAPRDAAGAALRFVSRQGHGAAGVAATATRGGQASHRLAASRGLH